MSINLPILWEDKVNSPELKAFLAQYGPKYCFSAEEINQLRNAVNEMGEIQKTTFLGVAEPTDTPAGTGAGYWEVITPGTYIYYGGKVLGVDERGLIARDTAGAFKLSKVPFSFSSYAKNVDLTSLQLKVSDVEDTIVQKNTAIFFRNGYFDKDTLAFNLTFQGIGMSDYISIASVEKIVSPVAMGNHFAINYFNSNKVFISGTDNLTVLKSSFPVGTAYFIYQSYNPYNPCSVFYSKTLLLINELNIPTLKEDVVIIENNVNTLQNSSNKEIVQPFFANGYFDKDTLAFSNFSSCGRTNYISTENVDKIVATKTFDVHFAINYFNSNKVFISGTNNLTVLKSSFPAGTAYFIYQSYNPIGICTTFQSIINLVSKLENDILEIKIDNVVSDSFFPQQLVLIDGGTQNVYLPGFISQKNLYGKNTLLTANKRTVNKEISILQPSDSSIILTHKNIDTAIPVVWIKKGTYLFTGSRVVLPIGDSLTQHSYWVNEFSRQLSGIGNAVSDVTGSLSPMALNISVIGTLGTQTVKHEGRGSWNANHYLTQASIYGLNNAFWNPATSSFDINYYLTQNNFYSSLGGKVLSDGSNLDVILYLGWNNNSDGVIYSEMQTLINLIKTALPLVNIILIGLQTPGFEVWEFGKNKYYDILENIIKDSITKKALSTNISKVSFFPISMYYNPKDCYNLSSVKPTIRAADDFYYNNDHIHPSPNGYGLIADIITAQYLDYLKK